MRHRWKNRVTPLERAVVMAGWFGTCGIALVQLLVEGHL